MKASKNLKKIVILEIIALLGLIGAIVYSVIVIRNSKNNIVSNNGFVAVMDAQKKVDLQVLSDGEALNNSGLIYSVTNNNKVKKDYKVVLFLNNHDESVINKLKITTNDITISYISNLPRHQGGYVIAEGLLGPGFTKKYEIKIWFDKDSPKEIENNKINITFKLVV